MGFASVQLMKTVGVSILRFLDFCFSSTTFPSFGGFPVDFSFHIQKRASLFCNLSSCSALQSQQTHSLLRKKSVSLHVMPHGVVRDRWPWLRARICKGHY